MRRTVKSKRVVPVRNKKYPPFDMKLAYDMVVDIYRMNGWNSKGEPPKMGWESGAATLGSLKENPFLDPDYEPPEAPERMTMRELKELL